MKLITTAAVGVLAVSALCAQPKPGAPCTIMSLDQAAAVIGAGAKLELSVPEGKNRMCTFLAGSKRLAAALSEEGAMAAMRKSQLEEVRKENNGKVEKGVGDFAISYSDGDVSAVMAIKGGKLADVRTTDAGTSTALFEELKKAASALLSK